MACPMEPPALQDCNRSSRRRAPGLAGFDAGRTILPGIAIPFESCGTRPFCPASVRVRTDHPATVYVLRAFIRQAQFTEFARGFRTKGVRNFGIFLAMTNVFLNSHMDALPVCPKCGTPLPTGVSNDECPKCQLSFILAVGAESEVSPAPGPAKSESGPLHGAGSRVGSCKLLQLIGEGGMGSVWMAEKAVPIRRMVALKLVKLGMDTKQVIARFEAERQALALMDHPKPAR